MRFFRTKRAKVIWTVILLGAMSLALFLFLDLLLAWQLKPSLVTDALKYGGFLIIVEVVAWLWNRNTEKALARAEHSEKALREKSDSLEAIVAERTHELRQAQAEKLSQLYRFAEFGRLASGIFHDLMNPLAAIAANVNELNDTMHPEARELKQHVGRALVSSQKMDRFVAVIRKQISLCGRQSLFCVNEEVEDALTLLAHKAAKEKVELQWNSSERVTTYGNAVEFHHVASNLISNAIDSYADWPAAERKVSIRLTQKKGQIKLAVRDHGCGIPMHLQEKIFDAFFTNKPNHRGMGIGLSNTKKIVTEHFHGTICLKSIEKQGSNFTIVFPRASDQEC